MTLECWNKKMSDNHNRVYYINLESGISQWGIPVNNMLLPAGWEMHLSESKNIPFYSNFKKNITKWDFPTKEDGNKVPEGWKEMRSSNCESIYYKNTKTGEGRWIIPDDLSIKPVGIGIPKSFRDIVEDCTKNDEWKWEKTDKIGSGAYGSVYKTCQGMDCDYVVKVQKKNKEYYTEIEALLSLQYTKAVPKVFAAWTCKNFGYFVIEKLYLCKHNDNFMWKEVGKKLDIIRRAGYLHLDIYNDNVMCNKEGEVILIDFGSAIKRTEQGDEQKYITKAYKVPLTWKDLEILQEESRNYFFNPAALTDSDPESITEEHKLAHEKATKNYNDVQEKIRKQKGIGVKPDDDIPTIFVESTKPITKLPKKDVNPVGIGIPTSFLPIVENCTLNNKWRKDKKIDSGLSGSTYIACNHADCEYVIKVQKQNKEYYTEIEALLYLQRTKATPIIFAAWTCENFGYFVMEKLYPCKHDDNFMWKEVGKKLDIIRQAGYLHVDIHPNNVMCKKNGTVVLIDFGYSVKRTDKGDKQEYPDNKVSQNYKLPLTWEYLEIVQENNHNRYFNPAVNSLDIKSITKEQRLADEKCKTKYNDARTKLLQAKEEEKIRKQKEKETIENTLQIHLKYQNGLEKDFPSWEKAKNEIISGKKKKHWIWYVFPSFLPVRKTSSMPFLMLKDLEEVKAYIANNVLRKRLIEITNIAQNQLNKGIKADILFKSELDALKFWECITLFFLVSDNGISIELHEVCGKALNALNPIAQIQDRLEPDTMNAFIKADGEILEQKRNIQKENK